MSNIKSMYAIAKLKKNIKGFGLRKFKEEALQVYEETCQLLAEGDQSRLRQVSIYYSPAATMTLHIDNPHAQVGIGDCKASIVIVHMK